MAPRAFGAPRPTHEDPAIHPGSGPAPSHRPGPVPGKPQGAPLPAVAGTLAPPRPLRILLAEDDPMVARSTATVLRRLGHTVTHALDGSAAWRSLQARMHQFDVLLLDVMLPHMHGPDLARRARAAGFTGPIILISGLLMQIAPETLKQLGIRTFMTKPFLPIDLDRALRGG